MDAKETNRKHDVTSERLNLEVLRRHAAAAQWMTQRHRWTCGQLHRQAARRLLGRENQIFWYKSDRNRMTSKAGWKGRTKVVLPVVSYDVCSLRILWALDWNDFCKWFSLQEAFCFLEENNGTLRPVRWTKRERNVNETSIVCTKLSCRWYIGSNKLSAFLLMLLNFSHFFCLRWEQFSRCSLKSGPVVRW